MQDGNEYFAGFLKKKIYISYSILIFFQGPRIPKLSLELYTRTFKEDIPSDIDKLLDVKVETNNKH